MGWKDVFVLIYDDIFVAFFAESLKFDEVVKLHIAT